MTIEEAISHAEDIACRKCDDEGEEEQNEGGAK